MKCNICNSSDFTTFNSRPNALCESCGSLERHRAVYEVLLDKNILPEINSVLHLAPETCLVNYLQQHNLKEYILADVNIKHYKEVFDLDCIYFDASSKYDFDDNKFDLILHNHVLEHLKGDYNNHIIEMIRVLKPRGKIIFTIPYYKNVKNTEQNGEYLTNQQRKSLYGEEDHYKIFGRDFLYYLSTLKNAKVEILSLENFSSMDTIFLIEKEL